MNFAKSLRYYYAIKRIIETGKSVVAGPVHLVQGGTAFICRSPIYIFDRDRENDTYWGLASIVIDKDTLFKAAGFHSQNDTTRIAIRGTDGMGEQGGHIDGDFNVFQKNPAVLSVNIPGGSSQLGAIPRDGWETLSPYIYLIRGIGILVSLAISLLFFLWMRSRELVQCKIEYTLKKIKDKE